MKTMNGFTNELIVKKAKRNWRTRCGAFLLAVLASWCGENAFSQVVINVPGTYLGANNSFAQTPAQGGNVQIPNAGTGGTPATTQFLWTGYYDQRDGVNYLNQLTNGMTVRTQNTDGTFGTTQLYTYHNLAFQSGSGIVLFNNDMAWSGNFAVAGAGTVGNIEAAGGMLNLGSHLTVGAGNTLNVDTYRSNLAINGTSGVRVAAGARNEGKININGTLFYLDGEMAGGGTIEISNRGMLYLNTQTVSQNIIGNYNDNDTALSGRGLIIAEYAGTTALNGTLSNNVGISGGGTVRINASNTGLLSQLTLLNSTNVIISSQDNAGNAGIVLSGGGALSRAANTPGGDLHINNNITVVGTGGLNSLITSGWAWTSNADWKHDDGLRFYIDGSLNSRFIGGLLNVNQSGSGTVVLTGKNSGLNYRIFNGVLEVADQSNLGPTDYTANYGIEIGNRASNPNSMAIFRVVGNEGDTKTIQHWIDLQNADSFYEVFTNAVIQFQRDIDGNILYFDANGNIVADSTLGNPRQTGMTNIQALRDENRLKVVQVGQVRGDGNLNKAGDGILELGVHNSYTGNTIIWHGVLSISNANQINNASTAFVYIGGAPLMEDHNFRPVFETHLGTTSTGAIRIDAGVVINAQNSIVRTTGIDNETVFTGTITSDALATDSMVTQPYEGILNKDGAGTLTLKGLANWGFSNNGELNIKQGTVKFSKQSNLANGTITIGTDKNTYKDIENLDANGKPVVYQAILKLDDNAEVGIGNRIILNAPQPGGTDNPSEGSYIEVGTNSILTLTGAVTEGVIGSNLNKTGSGKLVVGGSANTYTGWNNVYNGTLAVTKADSINSSKGVDLIGEGTIFDMSTEGVNITLNGLRGGTDPLYSTAVLDAPEDWTRKVLLGDNTLTLNISNFKDGDSSNRSVFMGHFVGTGTLVKQGKSTLAAGFNGFSGTFDIQNGTLETLTDTTITGIKGKAGSYLDIRDNTLTVNIGSNAEYSGTIISSYPMLPYTKNATRPEIIKDGVGTLTTSFYDRNIGTGSVQSFQGNLTIKQGNIVSQSDFHMEGGGNLTFYVNPDLLGSVNPLVLDASKYSAVFKPGGTTGTAISTVHANLSDTTTGWTTASGTLTVGKILGNDKSDYTGLKAAETDSLYYTLDLQNVYGTGRHDLYVNLDVTGFGGVGNTYNTKALGNYLDEARVTNLSSNPGLASFIQGLWSYGSNVTDESGLASITKAPSRLERLETVRDMFQQLAPDTIANGMFMGLDQPWRVAFDRLNLDSQMVYTAPPQAPRYRGQVIANMRNLWFTPTVQSVSARSDGNAKKFGIDRPGYKLGFDKRVAQNTSVGFQLGYSSPKLHENDDRIEASDFQLGLYGGSMVGNYVELKGFIGFGHQNYKSSRNVAIIPFGTNPAQYLSSHGRYNGDTFNFSFEVSRPLFLGWSILRPTIGLDSEHAFRYAFTETGSWFASKFERSELSRTRARFGLSLETTTLDRAIFTGRLGYSALLGGHDYATATGSIVGVNAPMMTVRSVAVGKSFFEAGVGTRIFLNPVKTLALVGNYDATVANRWAEHQALVGFTYLY